MNLGELFEKKGINVLDFEDKEVKVEPENEELVFWKKYLKLLERNASQKEIHQFAIENGFLSPKHLETYTSLKDTYENKEMELLLCQDSMEREEYLERKNSLYKLKNLADTVRNPYGYRVYLRSMKKKDITPYGEDVLKMDLHHENDTSRFIGSF